MHHIGTSFDPLEVDERRDASHAVAVQFERNLADDSLDGRDKRADTINRQQTARILQPDGVYLPALNEIFAVLMYNSSVCTGDNP